MEQVQWRMVAGSLALSGSGAFDMTCRTGKMQIADVVLRSSQMLVRVASRCW